MTLEEIYDLTRNMITRLRSMGFSEWSEKVEDAFLGGATSGEILTGIRWHLQYLKEEAHDLPKDLIDAMDEPITAINQTGA